MELLGSAQCSLFSVLEKLLRATWPVIYCVRNERHILLPGFDLHVK